MHNQFFQWVDVNDGFAVVVIFFVGMTLFHVANWISMTFRSDDAE